MSQYNLLFQALKNALGMIYPLQVPAPLTIHRKSNEIEKKTAKFYDILTVYYRKLLPIKLKYKLS